MIQNNHSYLSIIINKKRMSSIKKYQIIIKYFKLFFYSMDRYSFFIATELGKPHETYDYILI